MANFIKPTSKGQITLRKGVLEHMGFAAGDLLEVVLLPNEKVQIQPVRDKKPMSSLFNLYEPRPGPPVTDEQIQKGIEQGAVDRYLRSINGAVQDEDAA